MNSVNSKSAWQWDVENNQCKLINQVTNYINMQYRHYYNIEMTNQ